MIYLVFRKCYGLFETGRWMRIEIIDHLKNVRRKMRPKKPRPWLENELVLRVLPAKMFRRRSSYG